MTTAVITDDSAKNIEVTLKDVRLSFFNGFVPQEGKDDSGNVNRYNFNTSLLIPKDSSAIEVIKKAMSLAKKTTWGDNPPRLAPDKLCLRDGAPVDEDGVSRGLYDGYDGMYFLSTNRPVKPEEWEQIQAGKKRRPVSIIGPRRGSDGKFKQLMLGDEFAPYSGCYANVVVRIYGYKGDPKKNLPARINASLEAVQFKRHGEAFGARAVNVENAFDEEEVEDEVPATGAKPNDDEFDIG